MCSVLHIEPFMGVWLFLVGIWRVAILAPKFNFRRTTEGVRSIEQILHRFPAFILTEEQLLIVINLFSDCLRLLLRWDRSSLTVPEFLNVDHFVPVAAPIGQSTSKIDLI